MEDTFNLVPVRGIRKSTSILPRSMNLTGTRRTSSLTVGDRNLIRETLERQKAQRERIFSQDLPFSWLRMLVGAISVVFVLTDVPRSGIGISDLRTYYNMLEPDVAVASVFMPWNYSVFRASKEEAQLITQRAWSYKFDTTSNVWRAFAQHLNVTATPPCFLYKTTCSSGKLPGSIVFDFIDGLVDKVALRSKPVSNGDPWRRPMRPPSLTVRTESEYFDRIHDYLLPWIFTTRIWRTNQAIFLPSVGLRNNPNDEGRRICFGGLKPIFCNELWINFNRTCSRESNSCREVGHVYTHVMRRVRVVQEQFHNASVDLTILESAEDLQRSLFTLGTEGYRRFDISTIIRARTCPPDMQQTFGNGITLPPPPPPSANEEQCETIYVDDYRYEIVIMTSDVVQWFRFVFSLRLVGQAYFFIRLLTLSISCYHALGPRLSKESMVQRLRKTMHLLTKAPTQCVVFGSAFPIFCYTTAHAADAAIMYRMLEDRFVTQNGVLDMSIRNFIGVAVIEMRSVWVYAMLLHIGVRMATWRRWTESCENVIGGITGVPEFFLTAMASVNIIALFRSTMLRSSRVLSIMEVTPSGGRLEQVLLRLQRFSHIGQGCNHFGGMVIDLKFLLSMILVVAFVAACRGIFLRARWMSGDRQATLNWPLGRTPVPYSAGVLWPTVSLGVHWTSDFFCIHEGSSKRTLTLRRIRQSIQISPLSSSVADDWHRHSIEIINGPSIRMNVRVFRSIQHQMESIHDRSSEVEGNVAFMNLVLMSDPIVYFYLRFGDVARKGLAYYQSLDHRDKVLLLPEGAVTIENEPMTRLRLLKRVHLRDMHWSELVQCG